MVHLGVERSTLVAEGEERPLWLVLRGDEAGEFVVHGGGAGEGAGQG